MRELEIARRVLEAPDGREIAVIVRAPVAVEDDWRAAVEVEGVEEDTTYAFGVDSMQACALAMWMAAVRMMAWEKKYGWTWEGESGITDDLLPR